LHKDGKRKPDSEVAVAACPTPIDRETFEVVQARLQARDPRMTPVRVTRGPTLLTGICCCAKCRGAMTLKTGNGGTYRYYTCSTKAREGKAGCEGRSILMNGPDQLVASHLEDRLLQPDGLSPAFSTARQRIRLESGGYRRDHLRAVAQRVEVADAEVRITGSKSPAQAENQAQSVFGVFY
jgi:site-specific DNA recombinase